MTHDRNVIASWVSLVMPTSVMAHLVNVNGACPDRHHGEETQNVNDDVLLFFAVLAQLALWIYFL